ncbi:MAG: MMPL family transporter [bacterium]
MTASRWAEFVARSHRVILVGSLVLGAVAALSLTQLKLDVDVLSMLPGGTPAFDDFKTFVADFGQLDEVLILIDGAPADRVAVADGLAMRLAALPEIGSVQSRIDPLAVADGLLGPYLPNYLPLDAYADIEQRLTPQGIAQQVAVDKAMLAAPFDISLPRMVAADPLGLRRFAARTLAQSSSAAAALDGGYVTARDGNALLLLARPRGSAFDIAFSQRLVGGLRNAVAATLAQLGEPHVRVAVTGSYFFALEDATTMRDDFVRYTCLALVGVLLLFWLGYGNLRALPFITWPLLLSTLLAFALSLLIYDELNALSLSFAAILYGLSIDSGIHYYSRLQQEWRRLAVPQEPPLRNGARRTRIAAATAATLASLGPASLASSATTAAAFLIIAMSQLSTVRQLGVLTALGMAVTSAEFFVLYPALGFVFLMRQRGALRALETPRLAAWAEAAQRHATAVRLATAALAVLAMWAARHLDIDPSLLRLRPGDSPALHVQEEIAQRFARDASGAVLVRGADAEAALVAGEQVAARLRTWRDAGTVAEVQSLDGLLPSVATQRQRLARWDALPRAAAARQLEIALGAAGFAAAPFAPALQSLATPHDALLRPGDAALVPLTAIIDRQLRVRPDAALVAAYVEPTATDAQPRGDWPRLAARLRAELPGVMVASRALLEDTLHGVLRHELLLFVGLATLANLVLLLLVLRGVRPALAALTPDLIVVAVLFGLMAAAGVPVDPINLVVTPLILGIGVDNCVYVTALTRQLGSVGGAVRVAGRAIIVSSLTTIVGFGFLAFSTYPALAAMGRLVALGLTISLIATFGLLPTLLPRREDLHR